METFLNSLLNSIKLIFKKLAIEKILVILIQIAPAAIEIFFAIQKQPTSIRIQFGLLGRSEHVLFMADPNLKYGAFE